MFPSHDTRGLHGSFTSALFLIVCCCFGPEVTQYESVFLQQSRDTGRAALSLMDRLDHYFAGQLLEAQYLLRLGRLRESYLSANSMRHLGYLVNQCSQPTSIALLRFAMACDLHRISDPRQHMSSYSGLLGQPADIYAVAERINLWWSCYILAHQLSTLTGLPNDLPAGSAVVRLPRTIFAFRFSVVLSAGYNRLSGVIFASGDGAASFVVPTKIVLTTRNRKDLMLGPLVRRGICYSPHRRYHLLRPTPYFPPLPKVQSS